ncbi:hypothetical protein [uncultured Acinetobacter sp.]|uniref:hypothetical protein n=1 Tax=uncultured Acinetobacter sp. TaxID=165433 RepID=UPI00258C3EFA|nr:hypothetical protein [uncultured Acinetobacter sp.]
MRYKRSIGAMRQDDWQRLVNIVNDHLMCIQQDEQVTNEQINDVKLLIQKLEHHISLPPHRNYSFNRWS